jgi:hypothetical protein
MPLKDTEHAVGRKKKTQSPDEGDKTTTKVWADIIRKAKMVSTFRGIEMFDYLDAIIRPVITADYEKMIRGEAKEINEQ